MIWLNGLAVAEQLPYYLFTIAALLALQFNCSRLSYLSVLLLLFYQQQQAQQPLSLPFLNRDLVFLAGTLIITFIAISKDRAVLSLYFFKMLLGIGLCVILAIGWQTIVNYIQGLTIKSLPNTFNLLLSLYLPVAIACIVTCIFSVWRASGTDSTIAITLFIWLFQYYLPNELPQSVLLTLLSSTYLVSILIQTYQLAYKDELTGLSSRRSLNTMALSLNKHYCLAMVDIDHFKHFNDTYGHDIGDQVLRLVATKLSKVKSGGRVFRYGGEEFTIVFENKDIEVVLPHLEELRRKIGQYDIVLRNEKRKHTSKTDRQHIDSPSPKVNITVSIGVAEQHGENSFENTLKRADKALYKAKSNGRNQVFA